MIDEIRYVLGEYPNSVLSHRTPNRELPVCTAIDGIAIQAKELFQNETSLIVKRSWGKGAWTPTPWVAILDIRRQPNHGSTPCCFFDPMVQGFTFRSR